MALLPFSALSSLRIANERILLPIISIASIFQKIFLLRRIARSGDSERTGGYLSDGYAEFGVRGLFAARREAGRPPPVGGK